MVASQDIGRPKPPRGMCPLHFEPAAVEQHLMLQGHTFSVSPTDALYAEYITQEQWRLN